MRITFYGAASEVTGSKHLVELSDRRILLDCGLWQGSHQAEELNAQQLPFDPKTIEAVVITHAHLDHVGMLPILVKEGYTGSIFSTGATRDLTELILLDAAKIQEQDAEYWQRHHPGTPDQIVPLYTQKDIAPVMKRFERIRYAHHGGGFFPIAPGVGLKLYDAGHILGSAVVVLEGQENNQTRRLVYTGDLGRTQAPLLRDPDPIEESAETMIMESTYGTRLHKPVMDVERDLIRIMETAVQRKSKVIIPAFSLGRTQELVYILHQLTDQGKLPRIPIIIDSPLASRVTEVFMHHQQDYDQQSRSDFSYPNENPLVFSNLSFTESVQESKALNSRGGPLVIISASGMASGGRVLHHLRNTLPQAENIIVFTGFQASGTLGRRLVSGEKTVRMFGGEVPVKAQLELLNDLSAHADADELTAFAEHIQGLLNIFLVHGETDRATGLQVHLREKHPAWRIVVPTKNQVIDLR